MDEIDKLMKECFGFEKYQRREGDGMIDESVNLLTPNKSPSTSGMTVERLSNKTKLMHSFRSQMNLRYCLKCEKSLMSGNCGSTRHILQEHLKKDVYFCIYCDYSNHYRTSNMLQHIRNCHKGMPLEYGNRLGQYQEEIDQLMLECFGFKDDSMPVTQGGIEGESLNLDNTEQEMNGGQTVNSEFPPNSIIAFPFSPIERDSRDIDKIMESVKQEAEPFND